MQETANSNYVFEQFFVLKNFTTGVWVIFGIAELRLILSVYSLTSLFATEPELLHFCRICIRDINLVQTFIHFNLYTLNNSYIIT